MSLSKLETLPNEILIDLLTNYVDPIDVLIIFGANLNERFNSLVHQCKLKNIDLTNMNKKDFDNCLNRLIIYSNQIKSLSLSEYLPNSINIFLSIFPTFDQFENLFELNLYFNGTNFEKQTFLNFLKCLSKINVHTLKIELIDGQHSYLLMNNCCEYLNQKNLRRVVLDINSYPDQWNFNELTECSIEYLTIIGGGCTFNHFEKILFSCQNLFYLNIRVTSNSMNNDNPSIDIQSLTKLRYLIIHCYESQGPIEIDSFIPYLSKMNHLYQFKLITLKRDYIHGFIWEKFLESSLPLLKKFTLILYSYFVPADFSHETIIESFLTPFWMNKKHLNIYRGISQWNNYKKFLLSFYPIERKNFNNWSLNQNSNSNSLSEMDNLIINEYYPIPSTYQKLNFVKFIQMNCLDENTFQWIMYSIHLNVIIQLNCINITSNIHYLRSLLLEMNSLNHLIINSKQLIELNQKIKSIEKLNLSFKKHSFDEKDILFLSNLYPNLQHIQINPFNYHSIHLLKKSFSKLITLTYPIDDFTFQLNLFLKNKDKTTFQYQCRNESVTIWIDQNTFDDPFWYPNLYLRFKIQSFNKIKYLKNKFNHS